MATLQARNGSYRVLFCHGGRRHTFTLGKVSEKEADLMAAQVERVLMRIEQGLLQLPPGTDIVEFVRHDGRPPALAAPAEPAPDVVTTDEPPDEPATLARFRDRYLQTHGNGAMEPSSLGTVRMHLGHVVETLGEDFPIGRLLLADLQRHVDRRVKVDRTGRSGGSGKARLSAVTIRKELDSLRAAWNWAALSGIVAGPFPNRGLVLPKTDEKPPFQTWAEIERRIAAGGLSDEQVRDLWDCLLLIRPQVDELLSHVQENAGPRWVYPMVAFAAHTGARRSEMLRLHKADLDLEGGTATLHENKRKRGQRTSRRIPLTPFLTDVLHAWLAKHPGGPVVFCWGSDAARTSKQRAGPMALSAFEVHHHFERALADGKWQVLRGWHVLRHSFVSCLAAAGIDQRIIDEFVGHQTEEQRRRYRHLLPSIKQQAITGVFG